MVRRLINSFLKFNLVCERKQGRSGLVFVCVHPRVKKMCGCASSQKIIKSGERASLVVQWLRIHLAMQETRVQSLVQEGPTCLRGVKPTGSVTEPRAILLKPMHLEPMFHKRPWQ